MKTDIFTKALLGVIALALVFIAGQGALNHITPVQAALTATTYQYKFVTRTFSADWKKGYVSDDGTWTEDGKEPPDDFNNNGGMGARFQYLGSQGWELVTDVTFSQHMNVNTQGSLAANGVVTREQFIFRKRI